MIRSVPQLPLSLVWADDDLHEFVVYASSEHFSGATSVYVAPGDMSKLASRLKSMLQLLQEADPTFVRKDMHAETAINAKGFEVDFLRRMQEGDDPHPFKLSAAEDELWPVMAERAKILTEAPCFQHVVIGATGKMAVMHTISPVTFVEFKRWLADRPNREPAKRRRDALQAQTVQGLMDEGLLLAP